MKLTFTPNKSNADAIPYYLQFNGGTKYMASKYEIQACNALWDLLTDATREVEAKYSKYTPRARKLLAELIDELERDEYLDHE